MSGMGTLPTSKQPDPKINMSSGLPSVRDSRIMVNISHYYCDF